jgi:thioredoxin reductase (NADPH)
LTGREGSLSTDGVFIFVGHLPNNQLLKGKFDLDEDGYLICDKYMRTNIPGIFAAGEIMDKTYKQVATSVGQGCAAAMQATKFLEELHDGVALRLDVDPRELCVPSAKKAEVVPA